jgi:hypothetical protein
MDNKKRGRPPMFQGASMSDVSLRLPTEVVDDISRQSLKTNRSVSQVLRSTVLGSMDRQWQGVALIGHLFKAINKAKKDVEESQRGLEAAICIEYVAELTSLGVNVEEHGECGSWKEPYAHYNGRWYFVISGRYFVMPVITDDILHRLGVREYGVYHGIERPPSFVNVIGRLIPMMPKQSGESVH